MAETRHVWQFHHTAVSRNQAGDSIILLGMGVPDTPSSHTARQALMTAIEENEGYAPAHGNPKLTKVLAQQIGASPNQTVMVTSGAQTGLFMAIYAAVQNFRLRAGSSSTNGIDHNVNSPPEFLCSEPCYPTYSNTIEVAGGILRHFPLKRPNFRYSVDDLLETLEARHKQTAAVIITNPNNPTGEVLSKETLSVIGRACAAFNVLLIIDEVYGPLAFEGTTFVSGAAIPDCRDQTITIGSLSKVGLRPAWRVGWICVPSKLHQAAEKISKAVLYGISSFVQEAALAVLPLPNDEALMYARRQQAFLSALAATKYVRPIPAMAGMFVVVDISGCGAPDGWAFAERLLDKYSVSVLPGEGFGTLLKDCVRVGLLASEDQMKIAASAFCLCAESFACEQADQEKLKQVERQHTLGKLSCNTTA